MKHAVALALLSFLPACKKSPAPPDADVVAPTIVIATPASGASVPRGRTLSVSGTASDDVGVSAVSASAAGQAMVVNGTEQWAFTLPTAGLGAGLLQVSVSAQDAAGNSASVVLELTLVEPTGPPETILSGTPDNPTAETTLDVSVSGKNATAYVYSLDCAAPFEDVVEREVAAIEVHIRAAAIPDGPCKLTVSAMNAVARDVTPEVYEWTVDTTAPAIRCAGEGAPFARHQPISVRFDRPVLAAALEVAMAQAHTVSLSPDGRSASIAPVSGAWNVEIDAEVDVRVSATTGVQGHYTCRMDLVPADTQTVYVASGAAGPCTASSSDPCSSIAQALALPSTGSFRAVLVAEGTYDETVALTSATGLYGGYTSDFATHDPAAHPTLLRSTTTNAGFRTSPEATVTCTSVSADAVIDGFDIAGPDGDIGANDARASVRMGAGCDAAVRSNRLVPPPGAGIEWSAGVSLGAASGKIAHNWITDAASGDRVGVRALAPAAARIVDNTFVFHGENGARMGIALYLAGSTVGPRVSGNDLTITANGNAPYGMYVVEGGNAAGLSVSENQMKLAGVSDAIGFYSDGTASIDHSVITLEGAGTSIAIQGAADALANTLALTGTAAPCYGIYQHERRANDNRVVVACSKNARGISSAKAAGEVSGNRVTSSGLGILLTEFAPGLLVQNNEVSADGGSAVDLYGIFGGPVAIRDNVLVSAFGSALSLTMTAVPATCATDVVERNRLAQSNLSSGFGLGLSIVGCVEARNNLVGSGAIGLYAGNAQNTSHLESNTVAAREVGVDVKEGSAFVENNIVYGLSGARYGIGAPIGASVAYNDVFGFAQTYQGEFSPGPGNVSVDPMIDPTGADASLATWFDADFLPPAEVSCVVRAGARATPRVPVDFANAVRSASASCTAENGGDGTSMGAYELD